MRINKREQSFLLPERVKRLHRSSTMATYNNKHWLLSHIRNSFISTDDTGMCEAIMLSDDLPSKCIESYKARRETVSLPAIRHSNRPPDDYEWYPGLDQSDDEDGDPLSQSYDVQMDQDHGLRKSTGTAQKLEKLDLAKRRAAKIKSVKCDDNFILTEAEANELFTRNENYGNDQLKVKSVSETGVGDSAEQRKSLLTQKLEEVRRQPVNRFQQYARFDGNQMTVPTKSFKIFLTMLPKEQKNYPLDICVVATAKIQEFIGLICYKCSLAYGDAPLLSVQNYGLYITEGDGEIDDFPPLDLREPCSKFRFSHLALVERKAGDSTTLRNDRPMSLQADDDSESDCNQELLSHASNNPQDLERMKGHTIMMEAPLYRSYRVKIFTKGLFKTDIQLGISGEKLEIDPVQPQNSKFWSRQKPISHSMDLVVWCEIEEITRSRATIHIVYSTGTTNNDSLMLQQQGQQQPQNYGNSTFRHYDFVTNPVMAAEIVEKINNIIDVRSSTSRREYLARYPTAMKKKKITFSFK